MRFKPHDYQKFAIERILEQEKVGLFLDMGLGKTVITLTAVDELLHNRFDVRRVLVIAPLRVAEDTWVREAAKWDHLQHLRISRVLGLERERVAALNQPADVYVINRENVDWLVDLYRQHWPFDMVVIDELSSFKSAKSKRFRALRLVLPFITRIVGLTGTPAPNGFLDLWPQVYLLDRGERLGRTLTEYRERWFDPGRRNGYVIYSYDLKPNAADAIQQRIADLCVSMSAADWLQLPERTDRVVPVKLKPQVRELYKSLERTLLLSFDDGDIVADNAAVLSNKLLQLANGAMYDENGAVRIIHDAKLDALEDLIEAANGRPVLVFYNYKHDAARILERLPSAVMLDASAQIAAWNRGEIPVLLAHPASAGHGLNLQAGGSTIVWFGLTWSLELYQQANARLHRQGQTERVIVHHLVTEGTLDEDVMRALSGKARTQDALLLAVKARLEEMRTLA